MMERRENVMVGGRGRRRVGEERGGKGEEEGRKEDAGLGLREASTRVCFLGWTRGCRR